MQSPLGEQPRYEEPNAPARSAAAPRILNPAPRSRDVLSAAFRFVLRNLLLIGAVYAIFAGPGVYLSWQAILELRQASAANPDALTFWGLGFPAIGGLLVHLGMMAAGLVLAAMALVADARGKVDISEAMSRVVGSAGSLAKLLFIMSGISFVVGQVHPFLTVALIPFFTFAPLVAMSDHAGPVESVKRGLSYLKQTWVSLLVAVLCAFFVYFGVAMMIILPLLVGAMMIGVDEQASMAIMMPIIMVWAVSCGVAVGQTPVFAFRHVRGDELT